ncbi:MarR family winged helix-turn-helix transcriptional regulator [Pleomorphovibrio marinus]|uniref:MarR family winged helix-turn-helix transcriptional regulator n=1 Tax=Pleomorphovibrio marinus TaxID=2164132 RepID=UPI000E0AAD2E|nr:MarR family transcriptional regulator [Pleomorphovibrio marinus]
MSKEETFDYQIKHCWHAISRMYNQVAHGEGITTSMGFVLININSKEGTPATKIAPMMGLESRSLTRMLKSMEEKGLIHRKPDQMDKRSVRILLTEEGKQKRSIAIKTIKQFNEKIQAVLTAQEVNNFYTIFEKINLVIKQHNRINQP